MNKKEFNKLIFENELYQDAIKNVSKEERKIIEQTVNELFGGIGIIFEDLTKNVLSNKEASEEAKTIINESLGNKCEKKEL